MISCRKIGIDGVKVFVREAGAKAPPAIVLPHGSPASSHMFRALIPLAADHFQVLAPEMVGLGRSDAPALGGPAFLALPDAAWITG